MQYIRVIAFLHDVSDGSKEGGVVYRTIGFVLFRSWAVQAAAKLSLVPHECIEIHHHRPVGSNESQEWLCDEKSVLGGIPDFQAFSLKSGQVVKTRKEVRIDDLQFVWTWDESTR